jgi:hypothetical protein
MCGNALQVAGVEALGLFGGLLGKEQQRELLGAILPREPHPLSCRLCPLLPLLLPSCMNSHASIHACMRVWMCICVCVCMTGPAEEGAAKPAGAEAGVVAHRRLELKELMRQRSKTRLAEAVDGFRSNVSLS